ncbi:MAG: glycerophosphodiester phosphodiesterase [Ruminococcaceae bacterium]|nr:glycerophosphodiester phosphodiesterase [Oscillospiraceae bacterium]
MKKSKKALKIILIILAALIVLFLFLVAPRMFNKPDMSALEGYHYAHRGYFNNEARIPENSLASFSAAIEEGYAIELDVQMSKDGIPMVFHDADLERMCGVKGKIWEYSYAELAEMKLLGTDEGIPTLAEALELIDGQVPVLVEYKLDKVDTAVCEKSNALLQEYDGAYCIQCFHPLALIWYRKNVPEIPRGQLAQAFWKDEEYKGKPLYLLLSYMIENVATRPDFISYKFSDADNLSLNICRLFGAKTAAWTLRSEADYASVKGQFDFYIFDSFRLAD